MTTSHWLRPHRFKTPDMNADVVIVGAGYVGLSTAFWISEFRPDLKIIVIDRSAAGQGASGRNAGFLTKGSATFYKSLVKTWGHDKALGIFNYAEESLNLIHQNILYSSPEIKFEKTSSLTLFQNDAHKQMWKEPLFKAEDFKFEWRESSELHQSLQDKYMGAFENSSEFKVDPVQLMATLKKTLEARKIQVLEHFSAFEITPNGVSTELNVIKCHQVVLALNGYFPQFNQVFKTIIHPYRAQMMAVELEDDIESTSLHYDSPERVYWRKTADKTLIIGGKRLLDEEGERGDFEKLSPLIQAGLESYLKDILKVSYKVVHRWSGIMGFTEHELPILTKAESELDTFVIGGFSGHGMGLGFRAAFEMAELLTGKIQQSFFDLLKPVKIKL